MTEKVDVNAAIDEQQALQEDAGMVLPVGIDPDADIEILFERNSKRTQVIATLGGAKIKVNIGLTEAHENQGGLLVQSLPGIMEAAYQALERMEPT